MSKGIAFTDAESKLLYRIAGNLQASIAKLSASDLQLCARAARKANETNIWWLIYEMRKVVLDLCEIEMQERKSHKGHKPCSTSAS